MRKRSSACCCIALLLLPSIAGAEGAALAMTGARPSPRRPAARGQPLRLLCRGVGAGGRHAGRRDRGRRQRARHGSGDAQIIGTTKEPNLELILALDPDLVILSLDIAAQVSAAEVLEAAGVPCAAFRVDTWQDYARMMDVFTALTGRRDLYEAIVPPMEAAIAQTIASAQAPKARPRCCFCAPTPRASRPRRTTTSPARCSKTSAA